MMQRLFQFPILHWKGQVPILPTLLLTLLGLRFGIAAFGGLPFLFLDIVVFIWQIVGSWRALMRHQQNTPDFLISLLGYAVILISIPVFLAPQLDRMTGPWLPPVSEKDDQPTGVNVASSHILLSGPIDFVMFDAVEGAIERHPEVKTLQLSSDGGRVYAARAIARLVRENGLSVHVVDICASACTLIFIASPSRSLGVNSKLGFHGYANLSHVQMLDIATEEAKDRVRFIAAGITPSFVDAVFQTSPQDIWFPSRDALLEAGLITAN